MAIAEKGRGKPKPISRRSRHLANVEKKYYADLKLETLRSYANDLPTKSQNTVTALDRAETGFLTKKTSRCELGCSGIAVTPLNSFGRDKEVTMACPNPDRTSARIECVC